MDRFDEYNDLKLDFCSEYVDEDNTAGEDMRMLVNQMKITMALIGDKELLKMWLEDLQSEIKKVEKDVNCLLKKEK